MENKPKHALKCSKKPRKFISEMYVADCLSFCNEEQRDKCFDTLMEASKRKNEDISGAYEIHISFNNMTEDEKTKMVKRLKKKLLGWVRGIPCTISVIDEDGLNIRKKYGF